MTYMSTVWFTSLQTYGSNNMLPNKHNMKLETIGIIFLVTRHDVSQPRRLTSDSNEHTYGHWRNIFSEFNMETIICINDKINIQNDAIFDSGIIKYCSKTKLSVYQKTYAEFIDSLMNAASKLGCCGPLNIDLEIQ